MICRMATNRPASPTPWRIASWLALAVCAAILLHPRRSHADDWDQYNDAERSAKDLLYSYEDFKRMEKSEIERLVKAICDANEDERKAVSSDIGSRVREKVQSAYDKTEQRKNEAVKQLTAVSATVASKASAVTPST
jgi:hypothetical protein